MLADASMPLYSFVSCRSTSAVAVGQRKRLRSSQRSEKNPQIGGV